jgi:hypothetical protein
MDMTLVPKGWQAAPETLTYHLQKLPAGFDPKRLLYLIIFVLQYFLMKNFGMYF